MSRVSPLVLAVALCVGGRVLAFGGVLEPSAPLVADGAHVYGMRLYLVEGTALVPGLPELRAAHGAVVGPARPAADGGVDLRYRPPKVDAPSTDTLFVTLLGQTVPVEVRLEPKGRVQLQLDLAPDPLLVGKGASAEVRLHVSDTNGRPTRAALRIGASVGRLSALKELAPGEYQATYTAPDDKYPQVAIVAALSVADGAFAAAPLRLAAKVTVPGEGEPGGSMSITVDGRTFGPQPIDENGRFAIAIIMPPGGRAVGTSIDKLGNQQRRELDLRLPGFPRLLLAAVPNELPADGRARAEVVAFAVDPRGAPERNRAPPLTADAGTLSSPQPRGDGIWSWGYTAPATVGAGRVTLEAGNAGTRIALKPAPPFQLSLVPPAEPLGAGSSVAQRVEVRLADASGSPVAGARLTATLAGGRVLGVDEAPAASDAGRYFVRLLAPRDPGRGAAHLQVELVGLKPGAPRRVSLHVARAGADRIAVEAWVDDDLGLPVTGAALELVGPSGAEEVVSDRYGVGRLEFVRPTDARFRVTAAPRALPALLAAIDFLQLQGTLHAVRSLAGGGVVEGTDSPPGAALDADLLLRPAAAVDLRVVADPPEVLPGQPTRVRIRLTGADGKPCGGAILYQASAGRVDLVRPVENGEAELRFTPPADALPGARFVVSVTETTTRVTVFTEVVTR